MRGASDANVVHNPRPRKIFVLPSNISSNARFLSLAAPTNGKIHRYLFCPEKGLFAITQLEQKDVASRSILFTPNWNIQPETHALPNTGDKFNPPFENIDFAGDIKSSAEIFVATYFDPIFVLLPLLDDTHKNGRVDTGKGLFRSLEDLIDDAISDDNHLRHVITNETFRPTILTAMDKICDFAIAAGEKMYRLNLDKLSSYILSRARSVVRHGLPSSVEKRFVCQAIDAPMLSARRDGNSASAEKQSLIPEEQLSETNEPNSSGKDVKESMILDFNSAANMGSNASEELYHLQRFRVALSYIRTTFLSPDLAAKLASGVDDPEGMPDFKPLNEYLDRLARLRSETLATRSMSDFRKRKNDEDDEAAMGRAEKKRILEEEEKRKRSQESRGVRDLKKADISGMKKMSHFFTKKPTAAS